MKNNNTEQIEMDNFIAELECRYDLSIDETRRKFKEKFPEHGYYYDLYLMEMED
jgi:hypothetical protein